MSLPRLLQALALAFLLAACDDEERPHCSAEIIRIEGAAAGGCELKVHDKLCFYCKDGRCPVPRGPQDITLQDCGRVRLLQRTATKRCGQHPDCKRLTDWKP